MYFYKFHSIVRFADKNTDTSQSFQSWDSGVARDLSPTLRTGAMVDNDKDKDTMLDFASKVK